MTKNSFTKRLKRAFTITELVIVIAVIAVLAAVLVPTFSNVVDNAKESHDKQIVRSINTALSAYSAENNGATPKSYEELMMVLQEYNLTDKANPFLLSDKLDQKDAHLVWYPNTNSVMLLKESNNLVLSFSNVEGMGNGVYVIEAANQAFGYILCTDGKYNYVAGLYYDFYITAGGDIAKFTYNAETIKNKTGNEAFANNIIAALQNTTKGYSASETIKESIVNNLEVSSIATINVGVVAGESMTPSQKVLSSIASLTALANTTATASKLEGKTIVFENAPEDPIDMNGIIPTPIGLTSRKADEAKANTVPNSPNVDFGGLELTNFTVPTGTFISSGAEWQDAKDAGYSQAGYFYNYGLFGSIFAERGTTVTIENLTITNINVELNGANETIGGQKFPTLTDACGIVAGYTCGNVVFKDIVVDGTLTDGSIGLISGYDAVSGLVGRSYPNKGASYYTDETVELINCDVKNLVIKGERHAGGFFGFVSNGINIKMTDCDLNNVNIVMAELNMSKDGKVMGAITNGSYRDVEVNNCTLTSVTTKYNNTTSDSKHLYVAGLDKLYVFEVENWHEKNVKKANFILNGLKIDGISYVLQDVTNDAGKYVRQQLVAA